MSKFLKFSLSWLLTAIAFFFVSLYSGFDPPVYLVLLAYLASVAMLYSGISLLEISISKKRTRKKLQSQAKWNAEELFNAFRGRFMKVDGIVLSRICGYSSSSDCLIVAIKESQGMGGWHCLASSDILFTDFENEKGYWYIGVGNFIRQINPQHGLKATT